MAPKKNNCKVAAETCIGPRVKRNFRFLYTLCAATSPRQRIELISDANDDQLASIVDVCSNIFRNDFKLNARQQRKIQPYHQHVRKLGRVRAPHAAMKIIQHGEGMKAPYKPRKPHIDVVQKGGLLPAILVPVLVELAASGIEKLMGDDN